MSLTLWLLVVCLRLAQPSFYEVCKEKTDKPFSKWSHCVVAYIEEESY